MAELFQIAGADDPLLRDYTSLRDVSLRKLLETERGLYIAEGEKVVRRAVEAGHRPRSFLLAPRWIDSLSDVLEASDAPCYVLDEKAIERVTGFHVHRGALAAMDRPAPRTPESVLESARRVLVAEDLVDHTNIGAVMRNVAALGFDAVLLSPRCADPLYRRSVKVAMGAVFSLPYARIDDWYNAPDLLRQLGFTSYAMSLAEDSVPLDSVDAGPDERVAVIVGSEGPGLTEHWQRAADHRVAIPMAAGIDSLNVAASTAIACWHFRPR
ncbi:RNA methyltransferase [Aeromicrobium sp. YIM 150415]|uniref:TrmH family RNA methyltransferase n=1 Tax=Aeromicrobium sp. YIM 150415 TaxID=2803912 RepID=UPI0019643A8E|nr:RNA methyltransferase [Aeromicrobium sp. YIM 150415]MBM9462576.1 RNA methyltransferase [Aeromicrobium sp. YIM 150415]